MVLRGQPVGEQGAADRWTALDPYPAGSGAGAPRGESPRRPLLYFHMRSRGPSGALFRAAAARGFLVLFKFSSPHSRCALSLIAYVARSDSFTLLFVASALLFALAFVILEPYFFNTLLVLLLSNKESLSFGFC